MAGFMPNEGEIMLNDYFYRGSSVDRGTGMELGLFTNVSPGETITQATITEPTGTGYARIALANASWSTGANPATYAQQTFTVGAGGWTGSVQGYFVCTTGGTTKRIVAIEVDGAGPYTFAAGDTYKITLNQTTE